MALAVLGSEFVSIVCSSHYHQHPYDVLPRCSIESLSRKQTHRSIVLVVKGVFSAHLLDTEKKVR